MALNYQMTEDRGGVKHRIHSHDRSRGSKGALVAPSKPEALTQWCAPMRAAQRARAWKGRSGSSLPRASHGNNSWSRSIPLRCPSPSWASSQSHKPRRRNRALRPGLVLRSSSIPLLDRFDGHESILSAAAISHSRGASFIARRPSAKESSFLLMCFNGTTAGRALTLVLLAIRSDLSLTRGQEILFRKPVDEGEA